MPKKIVAARPAVSVIIPAYRASGDIAVALDSVYAQTFPHFEVIVINDGSPDSTELEAALEPYRSRLRYIVQPNRGAGAARNTGIRASRAPYLAFLDADDRWMPDFLSQQLSYLDAHHDCDLVYADALVSGESPLAGRRFMETAPSDGDVTLLSLVEQRCNIALSTVVARRTAVVDAGLFDESLRRGQDFELWLRLAWRGAALACQKVVLAERRVRSDGLSGDAVAEIERALNVLERFSRARTLDRPVRTALRIRMMSLVDRLEIEQGKLRIIEGNFAAAKYHLRAARERPFKLRMVLLALKVAPRAVRAAYVRLRPAAARLPLATAR
jgi:glycosyltransferase involved in cell wall biosynthesis